MKKTIILLLLTLHILAQTCTFQEYTTLFERTYTEDEIEARRAIFNQRVKEIQEFNAGNNGYSLGCTRWTDRFDNELPAKLELKQESEFSLTFQARNFIAEFDPSELIVGDTDSLDWRAKGAVTSIKNQGSCGSCWSFSVAASLQSLFLIASAQTLDFSEQYLLECSGSNSCNGGSYNNAYQTVLQNSGLPLESQYPYRMSDSHAGICGKGNFQTIDSLGITVSRRINNAQMQSLIDVSPVSVVIIADQKFNQYKSGIFKCDYSYTDSMINHAVQVVGYNKTGNYYIIKNEWGTAWGESGFARVDMDQDCMLKREVWAVSGQPGAMVNKNTDQKVHQNWMKVGFGLLLLLAVTMGM